MSERTLYRDRWVHLLSADVRLPDGRSIDHRMVRTRPGAGAIVLQDDMALLLWRHRFITDTWTYEIPFGAIGDDEPMAAAAREVEEETGWRPGPLQPLVYTQPTPGLTTSEHHVFCAHSAVRVVHDIRLSAPIAAGIAGVGCASICHQPLLPGFVYPEAGVRPLWRGGIEAFNAVLTDVGQRPVEADLRELLVRRLALVPSVETFDPTPEGTPVHAVRYVGPLRLSLPGNAPALDDVRDCVFFYRTLETASELAGFRVFFGDLGTRALIATGSEDRAAQLRRACEGTGFRVAALYDMTAVSRVAAVAVHHGGPGVSLRCLEAGIPAVAIADPGLPERRLYANRLQSLGVGLSVPSDVGRDWRTVRRYVDQVRADTSISARCHRWRDELARFGDEAAVDAINAIEPWPTPPNE